MPTHPPQSCKDVRRSAGRHGPRRSLRWMFMVQTTAATFTHTEIIKNELLKKCQTKREHREHSQSKNTFIYITWITSADKNQELRAAAPPLTMDSGFLKEPSLRGHSFCSASSNIFQCEILDRPSGFTSFFPSTEYIWSHVAEVNTKILCIFQHNQKP